MSSAVIRRLMFSKISKKTHLLSMKTTTTKKFIRYCSTNRNILQSDLPNASIPNQSIVEYVFNKTDDFSKNIATECCISGRKYTYDELRIKTINLSRSLRKKLQLNKNDVIAVLLPNCPEFALAILGGLRAGLIISTLNPIYTPDEISRQLNDSSTKAIITLNELSHLAKKACDLTKRQIPILSIRTENGQSLESGVIDFWEFTDKIDYPDPELPNPDDIAFLPYSSGTTGLPKGVQLSHRNIVSNMCQIDNFQIPVFDVATNNHQDVHLAVLPKFHIYGLVITTLYPLEKGCKTVAVPKFTPEIYVNALKEYKPHALFVAPPIVLFLTGHPSVKSEDLETVRNVISGAAPLGALDEERFLQKANRTINILQGYGLTETSPVVSMLRAELRKIPSSAGSVGRLISHTQVKIVKTDDAKLTPLGPNERGEILVKGPQVMQGYHNRPDDNRTVFTEDGWLRTGDIGYYNDDKLLFITDRLKELIKVKGYQVPPAELEEVIRNFPDVDDVGVIGIPDDVQGEAPRAFIVPKSGRTIDVKKLNEYVSSKVAPYKQLKGGIEIIDAIPKNAAGKILRRQLKLKYESNK